MANEFGIAAARGRPRIDRDVLDRRLAQLAGQPVSLPATAIGYESPGTCPACGSTEILWGCDDEVHRTERTIHPIVWHASEQMADSYVCRACDAGWIEPDDPTPISWVRPYWVQV